jgi:RNA polymerase sigma-70 factor (ECF subfamily)
MDSKRQDIDEVNKELVQRAAKGDYLAFAELYTSYAGGIFRFVIYMVKDKMTAEDLTEEIFLKAWKSLASYKGQGQSFSGWLYRLAHNHVVDELRARNRLQPMKMKILGMQALTEVSDPVQESEQLETQSAVLELVSSLPEQMRQVIVLKFIEEMSNQEIEQITGKSQGAIRVMQMRALTTLRQKIQGEPGKWKIS